LFLGTLRQNSQDAANKGRVQNGENHWTKIHPEKRARGAKHWACKLSEQKVLEIREKRSMGATLKKIADEYKIHFGTVSEICLRKRWSHI